MGSIGDPVTTQTADLNPPNLAAVAAGEARLSREHALHLYHHASLHELGRYATAMANRVLREDKLRAKGQGPRHDDAAPETRNPKPETRSSAPYTLDRLRTYIIDRNINYSNVCSANCTFCAFKRDLGEADSYVLSTQQIHDKVRQLVQAGKKIYEQKCVSCHGIEGDGKGPASAGLVRPAANFKEIQPEPDDLLNVLENGVPGTSMPPWKDQLTEQERDYLSRYVQAFFVEDKKK